MAIEKRIMIIAGEASGDLHASHLVLEIQKALPGVLFTGVGGDRMREAGVSMIFDNREIAVTGFSEVLSKAGAILRAYRKVKGAFRSFRPDLVVLLDFPDFNLRVGQAARKAGIPVVYYISPQVWAWRKGRIGLIQKIVEKMIVILPFESALYGDKGIFVGHPLLDEVAPALSRAEALRRFELEDGMPVVALLPGSRRNEIGQLLPTLLEGARMIQERVPAVRFLLPVAPTIAPEELEPFLAGAGIPVRLVADHVYDALSLSDFAVVASGTATLETAILGVPMLIVYKVSRLSFWLARRLVRVPHIGLINMVAGERVVPELLQDDVTPSRIAETVVAFLEHPERSREVREKLGRAVSRLGEPGASARAARVIAQVMEGAG